MTTEEVRVWAVQTVWNDVPGGTHLSIILKNAETLAEFVMHGTVPEAEA